MVHAIIDVKILDQEKFEEVARKMPSIVNIFGGRYLSRGGRVTPVSGDWSPDTIVIIEFDNADQVNNWLKSHEYAETASIRVNATISNMICIESSV